MMLDEGYGQPGTGAKDAREAKLIRLGQLQDALLRDARFIVGIKMHTGQMSFDQAVDFFVTEGFQSRSTGTVEEQAQHLPIRLLPLLAHPGASCWSPG